MTTEPNAAQEAAKGAVAPGPDGWAGGRPDPLIKREHGLVGAPVSRVDGAFKVRGAATFAAEVALPGMVYAALAFSTVARGRIVRLDASAAEGAPGVVLVMTYLNAPRIQPVPAFLAAEKSAMGDGLPVMQDDRIHWNGQPIALVLAETQEQADHAASLIEASYQAEAAVTSFAEARARGTEQGAFAGQPLSVQTGDAEAALSAAPFTVDVVYRTPYQNHNAIEPHAATLAWDGDELTVHDCVQGVGHEAWSLAEAFGVGEEQVHVSSPYAGSSGRSTAGASSTPRPRRASSVAASSWGSAPR